MMNNKICKSCKYREPVGKSFRCTVLGDIALTGRLADQVANGKSSGLLKDLQPYLSKSDLVIANLETVVSDSLEPVSRRGTQLRSPSETISILKSIGVNVVGLANNHIMDCGVAGLRETKERLDAAGIGHFGAGMSLATAQKPFIVELRGLRLAILGRNGHSWYTATRKRGGVAPFSLRECKKAVRTAKADGADLVMFHIHTGEELHKVPWPKRIGWLKKVAALPDVQVVIGGHQHLYQGIERFHKTSTLISYGNLLMDIPAHRSQDLTSYGCATTFVLDRQGCWAVTEIPFEITPLGISIDSSAEIAHRIFNYTDTVKDLIADKNRHRTAWEIECYNQIYGKRTSVTGGKTGDTKKQHFLQRQDKLHLIQGKFQHIWSRIRWPHYRSRLWGAYKVRLRRLFDKHFNNAQSQPL